MEFERIDLNDRAQTHRTAGYGVRIHKNTVTLLQFMRFAYLCMR